MKKKQRYYAGPCRHCLTAKVNRPRGLCWRCYYRPGVKELYPSGSADPRTAKFARRPPADPTPAEIAEQAAAIRAERPAGFR